MHEFVNMKENMFSVQKEIEFQMLSLEYWWVVPNDRSHLPFLLLIAAWKG